MVLAGNHPPARLEPDRTHPGDGPRTARLLVDGHGVGGGCLVGERPTSPVRPTGTSRDLGHADNLTRLPNGGAGGQRFRSGEKVSNR